MPIIRDTIFFLNGLIHKLYLGHIGVPCKISPLAKFRGYPRNISIGDNSNVQAKAFFHCDRNSKITVGSNCEIHSYARIMTYGGNITLRDFCSVNPFTIIYGHGDVEIGSMVRIASHVVIIPENHGIDTLDVPIMRQRTERKKIIIKDNVWIGSGAKILAGVTVNDGAVIGAGSVVTRDVPENAIAAGVPAVIIRFRGQKDG